MANVVVDVLRKMLGLAEGWGLRRDGSNPCRFVRKYEERKRERFLTVEEFRRLGRVLDEVEAEGAAWPPAVAALRLLMLTGCRKSEVLALRWQDVDLEKGESLPMIGKLLGHTQIRTTARYAHLARDSVDASAARVADSIGADMAAGGDARDAGR